MVTTNQEESIQNIRTSLTFMIGDFLQGQWITWTNDLQNGNHALTLFKDNYCIWIFLPSYY